MKKLSTNSHVYRTLEFLRAHGSMTSMDAIALGNTRLSASIKILRDYGYKIDTVYETTTNRYGSVTRYGRYILREDIADEQCRN